MECICPVCLEPKMESYDPEDATFVALGQAVCSNECYEKAFTLEDYPAPIVIFHDIGPP